MKNKNSIKQKIFWRDSYVESCREKNYQFDYEKITFIWQLILLKANNISSVLEYGSNIGRDIKTMNTFLPQTNKSILEINFSKILQINKQR